MPDASDPSTMTPDVTAVFDRYPQIARDKLLAVREDIFRLADEVDVSPLTETLKWGQLAYLTQTTKAGSTIRLAWSDKSPSVAQVLFICTTRLVDCFRERHGAALTFVGDRAIHLPLDRPYDKVALADCLVLALTHKRRRTA